MLGDAHVINAHSLVIKMHMILTNLVIMSTFTFQCIKVQCNTAINDSFQLQM